MAKTNYNKISNYPKPPMNEAIQEAAPIEPVAEEVVEPVVEPEVVEAPKPTRKKGVVVNCTKLNVRKAPKADAKILGTLDANTTVTIYDEVGNFYKIGPTEEYCMKNYISVK